MCNDMLHNRSCAEIIAASSLTLHLRFARVGRRLGQTVAHGVEVALQDQPRGEIVDVGARRALEAARQFVRIDGRQLLVPQQDRQRRRLLEVLDPARTRSACVYSTSSGASKSDGRPTTKAAASCSVAMAFRRAKSSRFDLRLMIASSRAVSPARSLTATPIRAMPVIDADQAPRNHEAGLCVRMVMRSGSSGRRSIQSGAIAICGVRPFGEIDLADEIAAAASSGVRPARFC